MTMKKILSLAICALFITAGANSQISFKKLKDKLNGTEESSGSSTLKEEAVSSSASSSSGTAVSSKTTPNFANKGRTWYVSRTNGSGQLGTKERPAKDLGNIIHHLKPNDIVLIAGGVYKSKGSRGSDEINVPVKIYGGFDETFTKRDPWGETKTVFTGVNEYMKLTQPRLYIRTNQQRESNGQLSEGSEVVVDGIVFDNGPRNRYHTTENYAIRRQASPKSGQNPSPESGGVVINASKYMNVTVQNCVIMNTAPTQGALSVQVYKGGKGLIQNNLSINNTGYGIHIKTGYMGSDKSLYPQFTVKHNTCLFNWKHDAIASYGGDALCVERNLIAVVENNVFGFGHMGGVYSHGADLTLNNNLFTGNSKYDFKEINAKMKVDDILDESVYLNQYSDGNESALIKIPVGERWAKVYGNRQEIRREDVDAAVSVSNSGANQLRSMLGLNVQGNSVAMDAEIFLPLITIEEALPAGALPWNGKGCQKPQ